MTIEERRNEQIERMAARLKQYKEHMPMDDCRHAAREMIEADERWRDEHEPKVALAIREGIHESVPEEALRYGLRPMERKGLRYETADHSDVPSQVDEVFGYAINSPEGQEQR